MDWIQKYKVVINMNEEWIIFRVDGRKFTIKLVPNTKLQNKVHYYIISELKDIIDLTLMENDITEALDKSHPIMIESKKDSISSEGKTEIILGNLKGRFLDETIASYKVKCRQFIE